MPSLRHHSGGLTKSAPAAREGERIHAPASNNLKTAKRVRENLTRFAVRETSRVYTCRVTTFVAIRSRNIPSCSTNTIVGANSSSSASICIRE